jgi:signal transduction histidine kinase
MLRKKLSIAYIIIVVLTTVVSVVVVFFVALQIKRERTNSYKKLQVKLEVYSNQISNSVVLPLWNYDVEQISEVLNSQMKDPEVYSIIITEAANGKILLSKVRDRNWQVIDLIYSSNIKDIIAKSVPIFYGEKQLGYANIKMSTKFVEENLKLQYRYSIMLVLSLMFLMSLGVFVILWYLVIKPIKSIERYAVAVSTDGYLAKPVVHDKYSGELYVLNNAISQMVKILNHRYQALQLTEQKFRSLFEKTPISIWLEDISGVFDYFNELIKNGVNNIEEYINTHPEELYKSLSKLKIIEVNSASCLLFKAKDNNELVDNLTKLFTSTSIEVFKKGLFEIWKDKTEFESEAELLTLKGDVCYVIVKWNYISNVDQKLLLVSMSDITAQKEFELKLLENEKELKLKNEEYLATNEELSESNLRILKINDELSFAKEKAEESDKLKTAFLCNMSHEIRTPLNAIVGFSDLLTKETNVSERTVKNIGIIQNSSFQLLSIVNDVLTISRIQTGQEIISIKPLYINKVLDTLKEIFTLRAIEKNIEFSLHKENPEITFCIQADETKVIQVLTNLLSNAFKFTQSGSIEYGYNINDNNIIFFVKDTGIGISDSAQMVVFERFRQADQSISSLYGGTGLGLSISKAFVEMLGGTIKVESQLGKGSTFTFTIPLLIADSIKTTKEIKAKSLLKKITILVAEDEDNNYSLIEDILSTSNYTIIRANNGKEAVEICKNKNIDIVLMDIKMPDIDGITAFKLIKQINNTLPVIAQTAYALEQEKRQLLEIGFNDYISKPINLNSLIEKVNRLLNSVVE